MIFSSSGANCSMRFDDWDDTRLIAPDMARPPIATAIPNMCRREMPFGALMMTPPGASQDSYHVRLSVAVALLGPALLASMYTTCPGWLSGLSARRSRSQSHIAPCRGAAQLRSEERRVGKECRGRGGREDEGDSAESTR